MLVEGSIESHCVEMSGTDSSGILRLAASKNPKTEISGPPLLWGMLVFFRFASDWRGLVCQLETRQGLKKKEQLTGQ